MKLVRTGKKTKQFAAKATRKGWRFWWQAIVLLLITWYLWGLLPAAAIWAQPREVRAFPPASCAYITLEQQGIEALMEALHMTWREAQSECALLDKLDMGMFELAQTQVRLEHLDYSDKFQKPWTLTPVSQPEPQLQELVLREPLVLAAGHHGQLPRGDAVQFELDPPLQAAGLVIALPPKDAELAPHGSTSFWVELDQHGRVQHVLSLAAPGPDSTVWELLLLRSHGRQAADGMVEIHWNYNQEVPGALQKEK